MKAKSNKHLGLSRKPGMTAVTLTLVTACLLTSRPAAAQDMETLARNLASTYEGLKTLSVTVNHSRRYEDYFMKYRKETGQAMLIPSPLTSGVVKYFAKGSWFGCDKRITWGDRTPECSERVMYSNEMPMDDCREAWDGLTWQSLSRRNPDSITFEVARQRKGLLEKRVHVGSPLQDGFPFLLAPPPGVISAHTPDGYRWHITLDKMRDKRTWQSLVPRLMGKVAMEERQGQPCWTFHVDGGICLGGKPEKVYYKVWLPVAAPVYPLRYEMRELATHRVCQAFEVTEFLEPVDIGAAMSLRFPKKTRTITYTCDPKWLDRTVSVIVNDYTDCQFNPPISDDEFKIDSRQASRITFADTGGKIQQRK